MVIIENLTKYYGKFLALDSVSFTIDKGDVVGLLGPNGAGKSTTMKILTGFMPPTSGKVKKRIGFLPENAPLYLDMKVTDYLTYVCQLKLVDKTQIHKQVQDVIAQTSLGDVRTKTIKTLSKGYRQRLGIAQALVGKPDLIILDEPTIGLDPKQVIEIRQLIQDLAKERTLLLSSHILSEVEAVCNKVVIMNHGKILARESVGHLTSKVKDSIYELQTREQVNWQNISLSELGIKILNSGKDGWVEFSVKGNKDLHEIMKVFIDQKVPFTELRKKETRLEDVYLDLVQKGNN
jgi:ABC-2 type transport system ATP-binding protein